jgi:hypothetical protein
MYRGGRESKLPASKSRERAEPTMSRQRHESSGTSMPPMVGNRFCGSNISCGPAIAIHGTCVLDLRPTVRRTAAALPYSHADDAASYDGAVVVDGDRGRLGRRWPASSNTTALIGVMIVAFLGAVAIVLRERGLRYMRA